MSQFHLFEAPTKSKKNGHGAGPSITCRVIAIDEAVLAKVLGIHNPRGAAYSAWRRLFRENPDLTPHDVARAVREICLLAELWVDEVAAQLDRLEPYSLRRPIYQRRRRRLAWRRTQSRPTVSAAASIE